MKNHIVHNLHPLLNILGMFGWPKFDLPECQLTALVESGFTGIQIASMVSESY